MVILGVTYYQHSYIICRAPLHKYLHSVSFFNHIGVTSFAGNVKKYLFYDSHGIEVAEVVFIPCQLITPSPYQPITYPITHPISHPFKPSHGAWHYHCFGVIYKVFVNMLTIEGICFIPLILESMARDSKWFATFWLIRVISVKISHFCASLCIITSWSVCMNHDPTFLVRQLTCPENYHKHKTVSIKI